jgi:hypothetical protein
MRPAERLQLLLGRPRLLLAGAIVLQWLTTLAVGLRANDVDLGARGFVNVLVLGPLALFYGARIAGRIGGAALAAWTLLIWVALPWLAPAFTLASYDATLRDDVLPLALGLTGDGGYLAGVAALLAVEAAIRRGRNEMLLGALLLAFLAATLLVRGGSGSFSLDALQANMAGLREYFWSQRLLQWLPLAGVVAVARRSVPLAVLLGGWLGSVLVFRAARTGVGFENGEFFRVLLPALPAYILLAAALPLLVPTLATRLSPQARPLEAP